VIAGTEDHSAVAPCDVIEVDRVDQRLIRPVRAVPDDEPARIHREADLEADAWVAADDEVIAVGDRDHRVVALEQHLGTMEVHRAPRACTVEVLDVDQVEGGQDGCGVHFWLRWVRVALAPSFPQRSRSPGSGTFHCQRRPA
jgi:hypothetical protein